MFYLTLMCSTYMNTHSNFTFAVSFVPLYYIATVRHRFAQSRYLTKEGNQPLKLLLYDITVSLVSHCSLVGSSLGCDNPNSLLQVVFYLNGTVYAEGKNREILRLAS